MIVIGKWDGLITNASPYSVPPTAAITQVNIQCLVPGELRSRQGLTSVSFTTHTGTTAPIIRAVHYQNGSVPNIVYQNSAGKVFVAKGAS